MTVHYKIKTNEFAMKFHSLQIIHRVHWTIDVSKGGLLETVIFMHHETKFMDNFIESLMFQGKFTAKKI